MAVRKPIGNAALKHELLVLAGYLAPTEAISAEENQVNIQRTVARICADPNAGIVRIALIASLLAEELDAEFP